MKQLMITLAIFGMSCYGVAAQAQTCRTGDKAKTHRVAHLSHHSHKATMADKYQVCREEGGYYTCCVYKHSATARLR